MEEKPVKNKKLYPLLPLILALGILLVTISAFATTFGPIPLVEQMIHSQYIVRGKIHGKRVDMEPFLHKPFTYWTMQVTEELQGPQALPSEIQIRQPGGEIGDLGYHIPSSAGFVDGEESIVYLHDTREGDSVKDVIGLASGKYTVEEDALGEKILRSGLGMLAPSANGKALTLAEYKQILRRVQLKQIREEDRSLILNAQTYHDNNHTPFADLKSGDHREIASVNNLQNPTNSNKPTDSVKTVQSSPEASDKAAVRFAWIIILSLIASMMVATVFIVRSSR